MDRYQNVILLGFNAACRNSNLSITVIDLAVLRDIVVFCVGSPGSKRTTRDWQSDALATELSGPDI